MGILAIEAVGVGKVFRIGHHSQRATTLSERLGRSLTGPFRRAAKLVRGEASGAAELDEEFAALEEVSFTVEQGEVLGLLGRNGAGKSTLLKILARITEPTAGQVIVRGRVGSLLEVGTGFHPELTGRENVFLNGAILGMQRREIQRKFDDIVAFSDVERFLDTPVKHYSSGMYLRLAFAVAAYVEPEILLVDEVLAVGDAEFQRKCLAKMHDASRSGRTVLFVSHNMAAIENLCERAIWIDQGRVREDGVARDVIHHYLSGSSAAKRGDGDLSRAERRVGTGEVRFTRFEYLQANGSPAQVVRSGDALRIRLHFRVEEAVKEPHFGFELWTGLGTLLTSPSTWASGVTIGRLEPGEHHVDFAIDCLNLMPDRYYLTPWTASIGHGDRDKIDQGIVLDVEVSDYFGSGHGIDSRLGVMFFPCSWSFDR